MHRRRPPPQGKAAEAARAVDDRVRAAVEEAVGRAKAQAQQAAAQANKDNERFKNLAVQEERVRLTEEFKVKAKEREASAAAREKEAVERAERAARESARALDEKSAQEIQARVPAGGALRARAKGPCLLAVVGVLDWCASFFC